MKQTKFCVPAGNDRHRFLAHYLAWQRSHPVLYGWVSGNVSNPYATTNTALPATDTVWIDDSFLLEYPEWAKYAQR